MISGGKTVHGAGQGSEVSFFTRLAEAGLRGVEAGKTAEGKAIVREVRDAFVTPSTTTLPIPPKGVDQITINRARVFGTIAGYVGSKIGEGAVLGIASVLTGLSLPAQGALLAGLVKKVFANEGGKNE